MKVVRIMCQCKYQLVHVDYTYKYFIKFTLFTTEYQCYSVSLTSMEVVDGA